MPRHQKVREENRKRVAEACDFCKRTHQKCDSQSPCKRCHKRKIECIKPSTTQEDGLTSPESHTSARSNSFDNRNSNAMEDVEPSQMDTQAFQAAPTTFPSRFRLLDAHSAGFTPGDENLRHVDASETTQSRTYKVYIEPRMLGDPVRPSFVGRESVWSFLQSIRLAVDGDGYCAPERDAFTQDERRFSMDEPHPPQLPLNAPVPSPLPNFKDRSHIGDVFFTKTAGFIEVLDRGRFTNLLARPEGASAFDLSLLYLVLSIGLVLSTPSTRFVGPPEVSAAQLYFTTAKYYYNPECQLPGATSHDVPLLILMAFYEMMLSRWKTAYHYSGAAVRLAYSIGLHQSTVETSAGQALELKRNVWRSLVIFQTIISTITGLPSGLDINEATEDPTSPPLVSHGGFHMHAVKAAHKTSLRMIRVVRTVYSEEFASAQKAIELLEHFSEDDEERQGSLLDARRSSPERSSEMFPGIEKASVANVEILQSFGIMLLTRPFFYTCVWERKASWETDAMLRRLAEACVASSNRVMFALTTATGKLLVMHNSMLLHVCFTAAIILLGNEYFGIFDNPYYAWAMASVKQIFEQSDLTDVHTQRLHHIINVFEKLVQSYRGLPQPDVPFQSTAQAETEFQDDTKNAFSDKRNVPTNMRSAPPDSRASMAPHPVDDGLSQTTQVQTGWPPQPLTQQPVYGGVQHRPQTQSALSSIPHISTGGFPVTYAAYRQYPALEGIETEMVGASSAVSYPQQSDHRASEYWAQ